MFPNQLPNAVRPEGISFVDANLQFRLEFIQRGGKEESPDVLADSSLLLRHEKTLARTGLLADGIKRRFL